MFNSFTRGVDRGIRHPDHGGPFLQVPLLILFFSGFYRKQHKQQELLDYSIDTSLRSQGVNSLVVLVHQRDPDNVYIPMIPRSAPLMKLLNTNQQSLDLAILWTKKV